GGYVLYDADTGRFELPPEQAAAIADEDSPYNVLGGFQVLSAMFADAPKIERGFKTGRGVDWGEHDPALFEGTERFFRPNYRANLIGSWIPALEGVQKKLEQGAKAADVGCGHGAST